LNEKDGINYRKNFDKWFKTTFTTVKFPSKGTIFDYYINFKTAKFAPWSELVTDSEFDSATMSMGSMFISTPETASLRYFLDMMTSLKKPIMFVGGM
jgi:dynein heavy chain, axonemal